MTRIHKIIRLDGVTVNGALYANRDTLLSERWTLMSYMPRSPKGEIWLEFRRQHKDKSLQAGVRTQHANIRVLGDKVTLIVGGRPQSMRKGRRERVETAAFAALAYVAMTGSVDGFPPVEML